MLKGFGLPAQQRLMAASVLVVGAGGLGCPALQYLNAMGVGHLRIADGDIVERSNLHRQLLYSPDDLGKPKATIAAERLQQQNPQTRIEAFTCRIGADNVQEMLRGIHLVIDGTDNFPTRYLLSDAAAEWNIPYVYGSVSDRQGQVGVFNVQASQAPARYRDAFPVPPAPQQVPNCAEAGILGVYPGIIGCLQAAEAVKILTSTGEPLANAILTFDFGNLQTYTVKVPAP